MTARGAIRSRPSRLGESVGASWISPSGGRTSLPGQTVVSTGSQLPVPGSAAALGRDPGDHLVGIHDVAGLAVHAVARTEAQVRAAGGGVENHLVDVRRAEVLAGVAVLAL